MRGLKGILLLATLTVIFALTPSPHVPGATGQPDLLVREIEFYPIEPEPGEQVEISATIANEGRGDVSRSFEVRFKVDGLLLARQRVRGLRAGRAIELRAEWQAVEAEGPHEITVEVDRPFSRVPESDERNNLLRAVITVQRKPAAFSLTEEIMLSIGEPLRVTGEMFNLDFSSSGDLFTALERGIEQLEAAGEILEWNGLKLIQIGRGLPSPLSQAEEIAKGRAIGEVFCRMAASLGAAASALREFNLGSAVEAMRDLEAELGELAPLSFDGVQLGRLAEAAKHVGKAAQMALTLFGSLTGPGSGSSSGSSSSSGLEGKTTGELLAELERALAQAGAILNSVGAKVERAATGRGLSFGLGGRDGEEGEGQPLSEYHSGEALIIRVQGATHLKLEVYSSRGLLAFVGETSGDRLLWRGQDSSGRPLPPGKYFYRLTIHRSGGKVESDLGRITVESALSSASCS